MPDEPAEKIEWSEDGGYLSTLYGRTYIYVSFFAAEMKLLRRIVRRLLREGYGVMIPKSVLPDIRPLRVAGFYSTTIWRKGKIVEVWRVDPKQEV